jgi:DNA primase
LDNTVGTCGTAITEDQCRLLKRYTNRARLFYDGDDAGQKATMRAIDMLMAAGIQTFVIPMPDSPDKKVDPDEMVRMLFTQTN